MGLASAAEPTARPLNAAELTARLLTGARGRRSPRRDIVDVACTTVDRLESKSRILDADVVGQDHHEAHGCADRAIGRTRSRAVLNADGRHPETVDHDAVSRPTSAH